MRIVCSGVRFIPACSLKVGSLSFMVGQLSQELFDSIIFGDEGQAYKLMNIEEFLTSSQVVPQLQGRLRDYLEGSKVDAKS